MTNDLDNHEKNAREFEERSRAMADSIRKYLLTANVAALGLVFGVIKNTGEASWFPFLAMISFLVGLLLVGKSFFLAKDTALKRRDAALSRRDAAASVDTGWPHYGVRPTPWQGNTRWDTLSGLAFAVGVFLAAISLWPSHEALPADRVPAVEGATQPDE